VVIIDYLETPLSSGQLEIVLSQLYLEARALIRFGEPVAKELGLSASDIRDEADWISFMVQYPILIERPIIQIGNKAIIGRPPEAVLALIENA
ncbi:MAG TPA: ArsC/Spx/MgsR family protein, partial [Arenimonas sp.]|nr:ArsC/Spx/MgsR family protein [Arenimonas sp.]